MAVPFEIDPYEVLGVNNEATPVEIKKSYYKLCLVHHPDKKSGSDSSNDEHFQKIQFAYSILSDTKRRKRYDNTGSLDDLTLDEDGFDWKEYFDTMKNQPVTEDLIEEDRDKYKGSDEEKQDIIDALQFYEVDVPKLFEVIPHLEFNESEEERIFQLVKELIASKQVEPTTKWDKYRKNRKSFIKRQLRKLEKEAIEAVKLQKKLAKPKKAGQDISTLQGLQSLIQAKQRSSNQKLDSLITKLETEEAAKVKSKRGTKRGTKRAAAPEIDEEEFQRIQAKLKR
ncbi:BA75_04934T0 [Komagataella pastoris]|uniref:BA75_04934T0 n=1 Tax=Komagataella pastoris TaxID=4922 RepID=A0A1B2JJC3_PICPA|nr:BA75_04934T0 [Komagataella pastoris]